jgi:hypothetical protein
MYAKKQNTLCSSTYASSLDQWIAAAQSERRRRCPGTSQTQPMLSRPKLNAIDAASSTDRFCPIETLPRLERRHPCRVGTSEKTHTGNSPVWDFLCLCSLYSLSLIFCLSFFDFFFFLLLIHLRSLVLIMRGFVV